MIGKRYQHHRNNVIYTVTQIVPIKLGKVWSESVVYLSPKGEYWSRPIDNFLEKFAEVKNNN